MLQFRVDGVPQQQGSKQAFVIKGTNRTVMSDANEAKLKPWRRLVAVAAAQAVRAGVDDPRLQTDPLQVGLTFFMPRPASHYRTGKNAHLLKASAPEFPAGTPDSDKLTRAVFDALKTLVWKDDAQVVLFTTMEIYHAEPGVYVTVQSVYE